MKNLIPSVKGMRDFYPEEMGIRTWLYQTIQTVSESFGYQEWEGPILETLDLYAAKSGEELVQEQSFVFNDRGGDKIAMRPELTPTLARMVAQRQGQLVFPLRWWSFGPFWRYERPQKGRTREFLQWNIDMLGANSPEADAELIAIAAVFFKRVGLQSDQVKILVNDRKLMDAQIAKIGIPTEKKVDVFNLIDRRNKLEYAEWRSYGLSLGLSESQFTELVQILDDPDLWQQSEDLARVFRALTALGVADYVKFDAKVIRGLLYYTGTVFEAYATTGDIRRAICGGGRYDNLLAAVGGDPMPGVGFAMGDVVITLLLEKLNLIPAGLGQVPAKILVTIFDSSTVEASLSIASDLRQANLNVICYPEIAKLGKQFKYADRISAKTVIVAGPDEIASGLVTIKNLAEGTQKTIDRSEAANWIKSQTSML